jgi:ribosome-associated toxin RatA of RatAB toxin-antitoxin module
MNVTQPRSRSAVQDQVAEPAPLAVVAGAHVTAASAAPTKRPADVAEVEVVPVAGSKVGRARATILVRASADQIRAVLLDFPNYPAFLPNYRSARVETKKPDGTLVVHMEIGALGGMLKRWMRVEISPPVVLAGRESFDAKLLDGDVRSFEAKWVLESTPDGTRLTLESLLDPKLELPAAFLDAGSASGLKDSILAVKARAEEAAR